MRLKGAVVAITGASSGIGEATALAFARKGARLALGARRLDRLNAVAERCRQNGSPDVSTRRLDVGKHADARAFVAAALRDHEQIDVLVNNAGFGWMGRLHEMPEEKVDEMLATNIAGVIATTQAALPSMLDPSSTRSEFFANTEAPIGPVYPPSWVARLIVRTARFPRRDAIVLPFRLVHLTEPIFGGLIDHSIGEARRLGSPGLSGGGTPPSTP